MNKWDQRFFELAKHISSWSKDESHKVGCVIVGPDHEVRSLGYNGLPRNVTESDARKERPAKYLFTEHAERNAVYNAARMGVCLKGCTLYVLWHPCADCVRAMIQSGIARLVCNKPNFQDSRWGEHFVAANQMLLDSGIKLERIE